MSTNVNYEVKMTYHKIVNTSQSIGTDGCGPCVGIIAQLANGTVFCGHLACSVSGMPNNKEKVKKGAKKVISDAMKSSGAQVKEVYYASGLSDTTAKWIIEAINEAYTGKIQTTTETLKRKYKGIAWVSNSVTYCHLAKNDGVKGGQIIGDDKGNGDLDIK